MTSRRFKINVEILDVKVNKVPTAKGSYECAEVAYKELDTGKVSGKKIMSFGDKNVFKRVTMARAGERFAIGMDKDTNGYWQWTSIKEYAGEDVAGPTKETAKSASTPVRSTYETSEERAIRQRLIVNQSSISSAIGLLKTEKHVPSVEEVLSVADLFRDYVYDVGAAGPSASGGIQEMSNDIPY